MAVYSEPFTRHSVRWLTWDDRQQGQGDPAVCGAASKEKSGGARGDQGTVLQSCPKGRIAQGEPYCKSDRLHLQLCNFDRKSPTLTERIAVVFAFPGHLSADALRLSLATLVEVSMLLTYWVSGHNLVLHIQLCCHYAEVSSLLWKAAIFWRRRVHCVQLYG